MQKAETKIVKKEDINKYKESYESKSTNKVMQRELNKVQLIDLVQDSETKPSYNFSIEIKTHSITDQKVSGRCWAFAGLNIFSAIRFMAYGKGHLSGIITFLRSFALLILFLIILPRFWELRGVWLSVPFAEGLTLIVSMGITVCDFRKNRAAYATCCRNDLC